MKEIIEADTDPKKEVLGLMETFGPRRETMKKIIEGGATPMLCLRATFAPTQKYVVKFVPRRSLRLTLTLRRRCYASG